MHPLPNSSADCEARSNCEAGKAGAALERRAGEDGGAPAAAGALPGPAARRGHHCGAAAVPRRCRVGLAVAVFLAAGRGGGVATAAARAAAGGLRRVPVPRLLDGAGGLAAPVRAGGAAARPPRLLQSVPAWRPRGGGGAWPRLPPGRAGPRGEGVGPSQ